MNSGPEKQYYQVNDRAQVETLEYSLRISQFCGIDVRFPMFIMVLKLVYMNILAFRKYTLKYLEVKGHDIFNLLPNDLEGA